jgi:hemerythrin
MTIKWRDVLSVGDDRIDDDHRQLFSLINGVEGLLSSDQPTSSLQRAIDQLKRVTEDHFAREERIMGGISYTQVDLHKRAHGELIRQLQHYSDSITQTHASDNARTVDLPAELRDGLTGLLQHWLVDHILAFDMQLKPLLTRQ